MEEYHLAKRNYIKNSEALGTTKLRRDAVKIIEAGLAAVDTRRVIREQVIRIGDTITTGKSSFDLNAFKRVFVVAIGKCAVDAAGMLEEIIGDRITDGIVLDVKAGHFKYLRSIVGTHPFPSQANVLGTRAIMQMLTGLNKDDLVFVIVSGGGSTLLCAPHKIELGLLEELVRELWRQGANITEVNTVRKHLSDISGGKLAELLFPATALSLIFSDVPGNAMEMIASGPTVFDSTSKLTAEAIFRKYRIRTFPNLAKIELVETPKDPMYFRRVSNILVVSNDKALAAMKHQAELLGYRSKIVSSAVEGLARELGEELASKRMGSNSCLLFGGESTVKITGKGKGGRNQELALAAANVVDNHRLVVAVSSDGWDNTDIAGAIADAGDRKRALEHGLDIDDYLERNDSYHFWKTCGGGIEMGRTGINVSDFYFVLTE